MQQHLPKYGLSLGNEESIKKKLKLTLHNSLGNKVERGGMESGFQNFITMVSITLPR